MFYDSVNNIELNDITLESFRIISRDFRFDFNIDCKTMLSTYNACKKQYENVIGLLIDEDDREFINYCNDSDYIFKFQKDNPDVCPKYGKVDGFLKFYANKSWFL